MKKWGKNTPKEILYKAGLDELANNIYLMDEINLLSDTPSDLYDGINIEILNNLNCKKEHYYFQVKITE